MFGEAEGSSILTSDDAQRCVTLQASKSTPIFTGPIAVWIAWMHLTIQRGQMALLDEIACKCATASQKVSSRYAAERLA